MNTQARKFDPYDEYYIGERDEERRKKGIGENHWTGAESIECYTGSFTRNTMHGNGDYQWRYRGERNSFVTYEGFFYSNCKHGYGAMSYPDGWVFDGLFFNNIRWGPGIESQARQCEDVGLWRGLQLARLAWQPPAPVTLDLLFTNIGRDCVAPHRKILTTSTKTFGKVNSAIEFLKQCGCEPKSAADNWTKLYPKNCTDLKSQLCHVELFERDYYKGKIHTLVEVYNIPENMEDDSQDDSESISPSRSYFAWNNNNVIVHMMKHCFKHEMQRKRSRIDLMAILSGHRQAFKPAGKHELDCRTLLMASFLGDIITVAQLINECDVYPDVADMHGNTALMYAACGNQAEVIHFLVEAGANVDGYNDSCCTPLGVALVTFACARRGIQFRSMAVAVLPPPVMPPPPPIEEKVIEWNISHEFPGHVSSPVGTIRRATSKTAKVLSAKSLKNLKSVTIMNQKDMPENRDKPDARHRKLTEIINYDSFDPFFEESKLYNEIIDEYSFRVEDMFPAPVPTNPVPYLFKVNDMVNDTVSHDEEQKKVVEKNAKKVASKILKNNYKGSEEIIWQGPDDASLESVQKKKLDMCARIMLIIQQLLADGANPRLVRCPQSALFIATVSRSPDLIRYLIHYGADVNEVLPQSFGYSILDVAVSYSFTSENLDLIRTLLECRANADRRLPYDSGDSSAPDVLGPTLLHIVLARTTENEEEEEIRREILKLLLEYNCNPLTQFNGRSALDIAMTKSFDILEIFVRNPGTNLNAVINDTNQTVLIKMFTLSFYKTIPATERSQTVTNLVLFGANPLIECQDRDVIYKNVFVFAKKIVNEMELQHKPSSPLGGKADLKGKKGNDNTKVKPKAEQKDDKLTTKSVGKMGSDDLRDYKQSIELITECARLLHIRWLQAKLFKELARIVYKYQHRHWSMILKEHKNQKSTGLWLTTSRCLEIWDILKTTNRKIYDDRRVLKHLLCIVQFYATRLKTSISGLSSKVSAEEKRNVEMVVDYSIREHKLVAKLPTEMASWKKMYVMPELEIKADKEFNVCFECALPFEEEVILCSSCKLVSFCSLGCMRININRVNCHPCSTYLMHQYFPTCSESSIVT